MKKMLRKKLKKKVEEKVEKKVEEMQAFTKSQRRLLSNVWRSSR